MSAQLLKVLVRLMKKEGLVKGAKKAKELGFTNKQITNSVNAINKKLAKQNKAPLSRPMKQGTFQSRKNQRKFQNRWDRGEANFFKREKKIAREQRRAENQQLREERRISPSEREYREMFEDEMGRRENWIDGQTGPAHPEWGVPGVDF